MRNCIKTCIVSLAVTGLLVSTAFAQAPASAPANKAVSTPASTPASAPASAPSVPTTKSPPENPPETPPTPKPPATVDSTDTGLKAAATTPKGHTLLAYAKVGGLIPITKLGPHVSVRLGVGYVPPFLRGRLGIVADLGYSQTPHDATVQDPRVGATAAEGSFDYAIKQHDLNLFIGPIGFILDPAGRFVPYASVGVDLHFLKTVVEGSGGGQSLGENDEVSTKVGFAARAGFGYRLGPGLITGEVTFAFADLDHDITGQSNLGRVAILVGYTAMFGL